MPVAGARKQNGEKAFSKNGHDIETVRRLEYENEGLEIEN